MTKKELTKRYIAFVIGLFFSALGVAITKHGELGVSPISSVPNVLSYKFPIFSMGKRTFGTRCRFPSENRGCFRCGSKSVAWS